MSLPTESGLPDTQTTPVLLTVAGFDPSSGAGITADLQVFQAHRAFGVSCVTGLTVQSTTGVRATEVVAPNIVRETLECLAEDFSIAGVKLGMLTTAENVRAIDVFLGALSAQNAAIPVVLDPVLRSSSGSDLLEPAGVDLMRKKLLGRVNWITPNLDELGLLTGSELKGRTYVPILAARLQAMAAEAGGAGLNVVVTGGHMERPDEFLLTAAGEAVWIPGERVETTATHGTGCAFSSALLAQAVLHPKISAAEQVEAAKVYVRRAMVTAEPIGHGKGPMNLLWPLLRG